MKKLLTTVILSATLAGAATAQSVELPETIDGFYRLENSAFSDLLTITGNLSYSTSIPSPTSAGSVFRIKTGEMFSFAKEMEKLQKLLDDGVISEEEYTQMFMDLMNIHSWKSGFYPVTSFQSQGTDLTELLGKFPTYADDAIENFLNNDISKIYEEHRETLTLLCVFATETIKPTDLETVETFRTWAERYLTKWRSVADFGLYMHPVYKTPDNDSDPSYPTGEYYLEFKTPMYVGNMEKAQLYINNILTDNGTITDVETLDIWASAKHYMLEEISKDYPEGSKTYDFIHGLLGDTQMNTLYIIGEAEDGSLKLQPLPDAFNSQNITVTADDIARATWKLEKVDESSPLAVTPTVDADAGGFHYASLMTSFPYRILSEGMTPLYATGVNPETGVAVFEEIQGGVVSANTPVVIRSKSAETADNKILPLDETEVAAVADNQLQGTLFALPNDSYFYTIGVSDGSALFSVCPDEIPANSVYVKLNVSRIELNAAERDERVFDLFGREVKDPNAKGIFIVNGKKVVRF